jgi:3-oxoacyl-(acyl-carrier-protein) synthase
MADRAGIVITGLGLVLPHGTGLAAADAVFAGRSAVRFLRDIHGLPDATGAPAAFFVPPADVAGQDRAVQFAVVAAEEAWRTAGLAGTTYAPDRVGVAVGLSKGAVFSLARWCATGPGGPVTSLGPDAGTVAIAASLGVTGPTLVPVTACASGGHAVIWAAQAIRRGVADVVVAGAAEASLHPLILGSYRRMGVLAPPGGDPAASVRPFSATRRGFAVGEGAGVLVLESESFALRRGARPVARLAGWAQGCLARDMTDVEPCGETLARIIRMALDRAGRTPEDVDYVGAHGTATRSNDLAEARALRAALGDAAEAVSVSSTKGAHGHLLGATTAVETVLACLALARGEAPPTANLTDPDPEIALDCTPLVARRRRMQTAIKMAAGFGGQVLVLVLERP